jgi:hypothetical protein
MFKFISNLFGNTGLIAGMDKIDTVEHPKSEIESTKLFALPVRFTIIEFKQSNYCIKRV